MHNEEVILGIIGTTVLIFVLVGIIAGVFVISAKRRIRQEMELTQARLAFEKELRLVESEVSEQMMQQFAQELHDNIGQLHTAMRYQIETQKLDHPELSESFKPLEIYLGEVTQQLRILSRTLNYDYIGHIGLFGALQLEIERLKNLKRCEVLANIPSSGKSPLNKNQDLMVFRIFQEIIQNTLKHAEAKQLSISLTNSETNFELRVKDDGKGFDLEQTLQSQKANGLRNIYKRAELAKLSLKINTAPGQGTVYSLTNAAYLTGSKT